MTYKIMTDAVDKFQELLIANGIEEAEKPLRSKIAQLEAALRAIAEAPVTWEIPSRTTVWGLAMQMQETAKDALKEKKT